MADEAAGLTEQPDRLRATKSAFAALLAVCAFFALGVTWLGDRIGDGRAAWTAYSEGAVTVNASLKELANAIGYGGFIHSFKNYVLRGDAHYADATERSVAQAAAALAQLRRTLPDAQSQSDIDAISDTVDRYIRNLERARAADSGLPVAALDDLVRVSDGQAVAALARLNQLAAAQLLAQAERTEAVQAESTAAVQTAQFAFIFVLFASGAIVFLVYRTETLATRRAMALRQINRLIDSSPDALLIVGPNGRIVQSNKRAADLFGYSAEELSALPSVDALVPADVRSAHGALRSAYRRTGDTRRLGGAARLEAIAKSGEAIPVDVALSQIPTAEGPVTHVSCRDMRRAVQRETALSDAKEKSRKTSEILATVSHEFRSPLNAIIGFADLLGSDMDIDPKESREFADHIALSGRGLLTTVSSVLDLIEAGERRTSAFRIPVDLRSVFKTVEAGVELSLFTARNRLSVITNPDVPKFIRSDDVRIARILHYLVDHANQAMRDGEIRIQCGVERPAATGLTEIVITVSDSGGGLSEKQVDEIFEPVQSDDHNGEAHGSLAASGLGLAIARRLAHCMDGDLHAASVIGRGTCLTFRFRADVVREVVGGAENAAHHEPPAPSPVGEQTGLAQQAVPTAQAPG